MVMMAMVSGARAAEELVMSDDDGDDGVLLVMSDE